MKALHEIILYLKAVINHLGNDSKRSSLDNFSASSVFYKMQNTMINDNFFLSSCL